MISPFVGGAFGSAGNTWPHQLLAAFAARQMRGPVKLVLTRKQMYSGVGYRPTSRQRLAIGADRSGRITAIVHEAHTETSRYNAYEDNVMTGAAIPCTARPNMRSTYRVVPLDINPPTYMRGPGATTGAFALESAMDDLAFRLGIDPIELRMRNEPDRDQTDGPAVLHPAAHRVLRQGAATFGWSRRNPTPRATRDGDQLIGIGMAAAGLPHVAQPVRVRWPASTPTAPPTSQTGTSDMGPGTYTSMTQVAADALGLPMSRVRFALGDSDSRAPRRIGVAGPWPASARRCSPRRTCCATGSFAPRSSIPDRR